MPKRCNRGKGTERCRNSSVSSAPSSLPSSAVYPPLRIRCSVLPYLALLIILFQRPFEESACQRPGRCRRPGLPAWRSVPALPASDHRPDCLTITVRRSWYDRRGFAWFGSWEGLIPHMMAKQISWSINTWRITQTPSRTARWWCRSRIGLGFPWWVTDDGVLNRFDPLGARRPSPISSSVPRASGDEQIAPSLR